MIGHVRAAELGTHSGLRLQFAQLRLPDQWGSVRAYMLLPFGTCEWIAVTYRDAFGDDSPQTLAGFHAYAANVAAILDPEA